MYIDLPRYIYVDAKGKENQQNFQVFTHKWTVGHKSNQPYKAHHISHLPYP